MNPRRNASVRRRVIQALLAVAALPLARRWAPPAHADEAPALLDENSVSGKALGYVPDAGKVNVAAHPKFKPGQSCRNCSQYLGAADAEVGGCALVYGPYVRAGAWCDSWDAKSAGK